MVAGIAGSGLRTLTLRPGARLLADLPGCLRCLRTDLPSCLAEPSGGLACRLPDLLPQPAKALTHSAERLPCGPGSLADRAAGTKRLPRRVAESAERLARRPSLAAPLAGPSGRRRQAFD